MDSLAFLYWTLMGSLVLDTLIDTNWQQSRFKFTKWLSAFRYTIWHFGFWLIMLKIIYIVMHIIDMFVIVCKPPLGKEADADVVVDGRQQDSILHTQLRRR